MARFKNVQPSNARHSIKCSYVERALGKFDIIATGCQVLSEAGSEARRRSPGKIVHNLFRYFLLSSKDIHDNTISR